MQNLSYAEAKRTHGISVEQAMRKYGIALGYGADVTIPNFRHHDAGTAVRSDVLA